MAKGELAVVTGASTGIGFELARLCAEDGYDLLITADEPTIEDAARKFDGGAASVETVQADLTTEEGVEKLWQAVGARPVSVLIANAGRGLGDEFLNQDLDEVRRVIDLNVTGTVSLIHKAGRQMRERGKGRILVTGSIAGDLPGAFQAVYNGTKAFVESFCYALINEWKDSDVTVTCLMPGPTETEFFERAKMQDTPVGQDDGKADPAKVARDGYAAMQKGEASVVSGFMNRIQSTFAGIIPDKVLAEMHRRMAQPGGH